MRFLITATVLLIVCARVPAEVSAEVPATQPAATQPTTPYKIEPLVRHDPKVRGQIVRIDLTNPNLEIAVAPGGPDPDGAGPWETVLQPTSVIARANAFDLAVNTVFFMVPKSDKPAARMGHIYRSGEFASSTAMLMSQGKLLCA
ncbi:MAG: hypothetical protein H7144_07135, partial [Burkholderiales bacterium]|nr:hypothetical protein [Phycisphaerae bacterium]